MLRLRLNAIAPDATVLERAAAVIRDGRLVAFPTDTLYGLAADPYNPEAVARVFQAKGRSADRALPLIAADEEQISAQLGPLPPLGRELARRFWPGPLTLLIEAPADLAAHVAGGTSRVGVRVPSHDVARGLCRASRSVLTATSANVSGQPPVDNPDDVAAALGDRVDLLLDGGRSPGGPPSTIVDVTGAEPRLVRAGAILWEDIQAWRHV
jgi:L-threonylcarbamoyladenylate synthase